MVVLKKKKIYSMYKNEKLFANLTTIGCNDGLHEGRIHCGDVVLFHVLPLHLNRGLQVRNAVVADSEGLGLHVPPDTVVQWIQVRALRWPEVLGPELHVLRHLVLDTWSARSPSSQLQ